jgi:hypothetical protein
LANIAAGQHRHEISLKDFMKIARSLWLVRSL